MRRLEVAACALVLLIGGCERGMRDMYDQPRPHPDAAGDRFANGREPRPAPPGSVMHAAGVLAAASSGRSVPAGATRNDDARLQRGRERYDIYCAPCHSVLGDGDGMVVRRGFPRPPSFHSAALRELSPADIERVIESGRGPMPAFGARIDADDRAAIAAYVRALQLSFHATLDDADAAERALLLQQEHR